MTERAAIGMHGLALRRALAAAGFVGAEFIAHTRGAVQPRRHGWGWVNDALAYMQSLPQHGESAAALNKQAPAQRPP